jgi:hypothetical protein
MCWDSLVAEVGFNKSAPGQVDTLVIGCATYRFSPALTTVAPAK